MSPLSWLEPITLHSSRPQVSLYVRVLMRKFLVVFFLIAPFTGASQIDACDEADSAFIHANIKKSQNAISYVPFELAEKFEGICDIKNIEMMDGLEYLLYKNTETGSYFIGLYNGLDGSNQLHGPFIK